MIIKLEEDMQDYYSYVLDQWILAMESSPNESEIGKIRDLFRGENWDSILKKYHTNGSVWYVWWMDAVNSLIAKKGVYERDKSY